MTSVNTAGRIGGVVGAPEPRRTPSGRHEARAARSNPTSTNPAYAAARKQSGGQVLRAGSSGPAVLALKNRLREQHYTVDEGPRFTQKTHHAVMAFQKVNGLQRDGVAGPRTLAALRAPKQPDLGRGPADRVIVDLSEQVLYMVDNGRLKRVVNASSGDPNSPDGLGEATPQGQFRVFRHVRGPDRAPLGVLYDPSYFNGGIAVHGSPSVPAQRASHGCVRVPMHMSARIQQDMPVGTTVIVRQ